MSSGENGGSPAGERYLDSAGRDWGYDTLLSVNLVTCSLSVLGAMVMIIPFCLSKQLRKLRHQLILGMAVNDLLQSLSVLVPSAWAEVHGPLSQNSPGCNADSFFYLTFVVAGCFWTLTIAVTTYITLAKPLSKLAEFMHRAKAVYILWGTIWGISLVNAAIGAALNDSVDGGGFCFFPSVPPYLYGNLVLFIPRAATFSIIICIYAALWYFFRRQASTHQRQESGLQDGTFELRVPHYPSFAPPSEQDLPWTNSTSSQSRRESGRTLSEFQSAQKSPRSDKFPRQEMGARELQASLVAYRFGKNQEMPLPSQSISNLTPAVPSTQQSSGQQQDISTGEHTLLTRTTSIPLQDSSQILDSAGGFEHQLSMLGMTAERTDDAHQENVSDLPLVPLSASTDKSHWEEGISPGVTLVESNDGISIGPGGRELHVEQLRSPLSAVVPTQIELKETSREKKLERTRTDDSMGLWEALGSTDPEHARDIDLVKSSQEQGRRLSASEENRRVSYLMLLYPLVYSIVLIFSIARLIITLIIKAHPSPWLQILNRVLILGTGVFDACIYTIIEWRFRASSQAAARSSMSVPSQNRGRDPSTSL